MRGVRAACVAATLLVTTAAAADPEPWADPDPPGPPERHALGDFGLRVAAEYRAMLTYVDPIGVNSPDDRELSTLEHRLRLDATVDWLDKVRIVTSADLLDGVLWGDNGKFGTPPEPASGANVTTRNPNTTRPCVAYRSGDPLKADGYGYALCEGENVKLRRAYGEVVTPVGLLRVGRQPATVGMGVVSADGDGRTNRFGVSRAGNTFDRILFATKPLEAFKPAAERSLAQDEGLFFIVGYDRLATDDLRLTEDDLHQFIASIRFLAPETKLGTDLELVLYNAYRTDEENGTQVDIMGARALHRFGPVYVGGEIAANIGSTREISKAYSLVNNDPIVDQNVRQLGARAVARYDHPRFSLYFEFDYASGDDDPDPRSNLTQYYFAEDANVGLLLYEQVLAFQSARAAAAGNEILRRLGSVTFPGDVVSSRGAFHNSIAIFPQVDFRPHEDVLIRGGVLAAWAAAKVVDPVASLRAKDGAELEDDLVNLNGGKPGTYYGTELDLRLGWRFLDHFAADLEGAVLFPGDALEDENGQAVNSFLAQARTTFFF